MRRLTAIVVLILFTATTYADNRDSLFMFLQKSRTDAERIGILFRLAQHFLFKPGEYKPDLDTAIGFMQQAALLNTKLRSRDNDGIQMLLESLLARERRQDKKGKELNEGAIEILKIGQNKAYLGMAYFSLSEYYRYSEVEELAEKIRLGELAFQAYRQSDNIERQAFTLTFLADLYNIDEQRAKALERLDLALKLYKSINHPQLHAVYILYSTIYSTAGDYRQALNYGLMALKSAKSTGDSTMTLCQINNIVATTLVLVNERQRAVSYFMDALKIAERNNDNNAVLELMVNIVNNYIELQKPDVALAFMKALPKKLVEPRSEDRYIYTPLSYLMIYNKLKRYDEVRYYCNEILQLIKIHYPPDKFLYDFYTLLIGSYLH